MSAEPQHTIMDVSAATVVFGTFMGWLPGIAAGFAAIWYIIQIYDRFKNGPKK